MGGWVLGRVVGGWVLGRVVGGWVLGDVVGGWVLGDVVGGWVLGGVPTVAGRELHPMLLHAAAAAARPTLRAPSLLAAAPPHRAALPTLLHRLTMLPTLLRHLTMQAVELGRHEMDTWYYSPYPEPHASCQKLYLCEYTLKVGSTTSAVHAAAHSARARHDGGPTTRPP